jgi:hypothetical protein
MLRPETHFTSLEYIRTEADLQGTRFGSLTAA